MQILYFNNGSGLGVSKSGGTARLIEVAKQLKLKDIGITVVATSGSIELFNTESFKANFVKVKASFFSNKERSNYGRAWSYVISTVHSIVINPKLPLCDIVYSPSDYYCDVIPSIYYKIKNNKVKYIAMVHHICGSPAKRSGNFLVNAISYYAQRLSHKLIAKYSDHILVYDTPEGIEIKEYFKSKGVSANKISFVANGVNVEEIAIIKKSENNRYFDACFVGGLRGSKGIYDIILIWKLVVVSIPSAKIAIIGEGVESVTRKIEKKILDWGLSDNIKLLGALSGNNLYKEMSNCNLFISTSHEEGWGISVCEAIACGLPVVAYKLPAFSYLQGYIAEIDKFKHKDFCSNIVELLNSPDKIDKLSKNGREFIKKYDWSVIADYEYQIIIKTLNA